MSVADLADPHASPPRVAFETDWRRRRRVVFATLTFCGGGIVYLMVRGEADSRLHDTIANGLMLTAASVVLGYLGFPVLDDRFRRSAAVSYTAIRRGVPPRPSHHPAGRVDDPDA